MSLLLATAGQQPGKVTFYNLVLFIHVTAAVTAFGVTFAYPIIYSLLKRSDRAAIPAFHRAESLVGKYLISGSGSVILIAGAYLAAEGPFEFSDAFVGAGIVIIVVLLGLGGAFFGPQEDRAAELAERDVATAAGGAVEFSAEYEAVAGRLEKVGLASSALVVVAIFLMVVKPGV